MIVGSVVLKKMRKLNLKNSQKLNSDGMLAFSNFV